MPIIILILVIAFFPALFGATMFAGATLIILMPIILWTVGIVVGLLVLITVATMLHQYLTNKKQARIQAQAIAQEQQQRELRRALKKKEQEDYRKLLQQHIKQ